MYVHEYWLGKKQYYLYINICSSYTIYMFGLGSMSCSIESTRSQLKADLVSFILFFLINK